MAHTLTLVYGNTTVEMASGDYRIRQYVPATPEPGASSVTETATILITGSTLTALQADIRAINQMFERARMRQAGKTLVRTFVKFQASGEATTWLSEIYDGRVVMPEGALAGDWANTQLEVAVIWERAPFWEGDTWIAVPLTNGNGTDKTDGINVYNCCDGSGNSPNKRHNYVDIDGINDIAGELPAPVKIEIKPAAGVTLTHVYMGVQANLAGLGLIQPYIEVEDMSGLGTKTSDQTSSGGYYKRLVVSPIDSQVIAMDVSKYPGGYYKPFIRFANAPTANVKTQFAIGGKVSSPDMPTAITFLNSNKLQSGSDMRIPIREYLPISGTLEYQFLFLITDAGGVGGATMDWDFIFLMPTDFYQEIGSSLITVIGDTYKIIYSEGFENRLYRDLAAGDSVINYFDIKNGSGIYITPGVDNRLHFLTRNADAMAITDYSTIQMWYKPRRVTL
jgi:hypothetical protein